MNDVPDYGEIVKAIDDEKPNIVRGSERKTTRKELVGNHGYKPPDPSGAGTEYWLWELDI